MILNNQDYFTMFFMIVDLCLLVLTGCVSSTELAVGYIGCEQEISAESLHSNISNSAVRIYWARDDLGANFLSFLIPENKTTYLDVYNETKYVVDQATYALIIKDITAEDEDLYTRSSAGSTELHVTFTVVELSQDDLKDVLSITHDGNLVSTENKMLTITAEDTKPLIASTLHIENAETDSTDTTTPAETAASSMQDYKSETTTAPVFSITTLTEYERTDLITVLVVPAIVLFISYMILLTVLLSVKFHDRGNNTYSACVHRQFPKTACNARIPNHTNYSLDGNGSDYLKFRNQGFPQTIQQFNICYSMSTSTERDINKSWPI